MTTHMSIIQDLDVYDVSTSNCTMGDHNIHVMGFEQTWPPQSSRKNILNMFGIHSYLRDEELKKDLIFGDFFLMIN